jgi:hypothetical protein
MLNYLSTLLLGYLIDILDEFKHARQIEDLKDLQTILVYAAEEYPLNLTIVVTELDISFHVRIVRVITSLMYDSLVEHVIDVLFNFLEYLVLHEVLSVVLHPLSLLANLLK